MERNKYAILMDEEGMHIVEKPDGTRLLDFLYQQIGTDIVESVRGRHLPQGCLMIVDEEGRLKDNPWENREASFFYGGLEHGNPIVGKAVIVRLNDVGDDFELMNYPQVSSCSFQMMMDLIAGVAEKGEQPHEASPV